MSLQETEETNQFTFEPVTRHAPYRAVNRSLVQRALAPLAARSADKPVTIVDMACGTGAITHLIAEEMAHQGPRARIIGVDPSAEALRRAEKSMQASGAQAVFVQGEAADLPVIVQEADVAFFCNAIHLLADKRSAFQQVAAILAPRGIFACNSAFYEGTYVEGTERFYRLWTRRAVGWLRKEHPEVQLSRQGKATAMQWLTPEEYCGLLRESGFAQVHMTEESAPLPLDVWRDLGRYWLFIEGALPGASLALGAAALETAVYQVGQELGMTEVARRWVQIIAMKS